MCAIALYHECIGNDQNKIGPVFKAGRGSPSIHPFKGKTIQDLSILKSSFNVGIVFHQIFHLLKIKLWNIDKGYCN